jgi:hypothetical protein
MDSTKRNVAVLGACPALRFRNNATVIATPRLTGLLRAGALVFRSYNGARQRCGLALDPSAALFKGAARGVLRERPAAGPA